MRLISAMFGLVLTSLLVFASGGSAQAHTALDSSDPADGSVLLEAPTKIGLTFTDEISGSADVPGEAVVVVDGKTQDWQVGFDGREVTLTSAQNELTGSYEVNYRAVSADGHPVTGSVSFDVVAPTATTSPTSATTETAPVQTNSGADGSVWTSPLLLGVFVAAVAILGAAWALMRGRGSSEDDE